MSNINDFSVQLANLSSITCSVTNKNAYNAFVFLLYFACRSVPLYDIQEKTDEN